MGNITWYKDGIYSRTRERKNGPPLEVFYGRVWVGGRAHYFRLGTTPSQAKKKMRKILGDPEAALEARRKKRLRVLKLGELLNEFLANYRSRGGTDFYHMVTRRPRKHLGERPLAEITPQVLDQYLAARREERTKERFRTVEEVRVKVGGGERKISESTLRKELIALGTVFKWAKKRGLVTENPLAEYDKPKEPSDRSIAILSPEQEKVLMATCPPWVRDAVEWALYSGMRRGEVLKLRWRDVDQKRGVVHTGSKTQRAARTVPFNVSAKLLAVLERRRQQIEQDWDEAGRVVPMPELVFCERDGRPLNVDVLNGLVEAAARAAGIEKQRGVMWNRFRHTWATRLAATGKVSIFEISKWMGNSVNVCERHYAAYLPESAQKAAGLLDSATPTVAPTVAGNMAVS